MTVYVDDMHRYSMGNYGRMRMSHMIADTDDEAHAMAARIGVARKWYQGDHYDICRSMREKAVKAGAVEITIRQLGAMARLKKFGLPMGDPATAPERLIEAARARSAAISRSEEPAAG